MTADRVGDLTVGLAEVAMNSVHHGGGGTLRMWQDDDLVVCEVTDSGHIEDPLVGRRMPDVTDQSGRGLWLANQLCDLMQIPSTAAGTTVRVSTSVADTDRADNASDRP